MPAITNAERNGQSVCVPRQCGGTPIDGDGTVTGNGWVLCEGDGKQVWVMGHARVTTGA